MKIKRAVIIEMSSGGGLLIDSLIDVVVSSGSAVGVAWPFSIHDVVHVDEAVIVGTKMMLGRKE